MATIRYTGGRGGGGEGRGGAGEGRGRGGAGGGGGGGEGQVERQGLYSSGGQCLPVGWLTVAVGWLAVRRAGGEDQSQDQVLEVGVEEHGRILVAPDVVTVLTRHQGLEPEGGGEGRGEGRGGGGGGEGRGGEGRAVTVCCVSLG